MLGRWRGKVAAKPIEEGVNDDFTRAQPSEDSNAVHSQSTALNPPKRQEDDSYISPASFMNVAEGAEVTGPVDNVEPVEPAIAAAGSDSPHFLGPLELAPESTARSPGSVEEVKESQAVVGDTLKEGGNLVTKLIEGLNDFTTAQPSQDDSTVSSPSTALNSPRRQEDDGYTSPVLFMRSNRRNSGTLGSRSKVAEGTEMAGSVHNVEPMEPLELAIAATRSDSPHLLPPPELGPEITAQSPGSVEDVESSHAVVEDALQRDAEAFSVKRDKSDLQDEDTMSMLEKDICKMETLAISKDDSVLKILLPVQNESESADEYSGKKDEEEDSSDIRGGFNLTMHETLINNSTESHKTNTAVNDCSKSTEITGSEFEETVSEETVIFKTPIELENPSQETEVKVSSQRNIAVPKQNPIPAQSGWMLCQDGQAAVYCQIESTQDHYEGAPPQPARNVTFRGEANAVSPRPPSRFRTVNFIQRLLLVQCLQRSYCQAKASRVAGGAIALMEAGVRLFTAPAFFIVRPLVRMLDKPLLLADSAISDGVHGVVRAFSCAPQMEEVCCGSTCYECDIPIIYMGSETQLDSKLKEQ